MEKRVIIAIALSMLIILSFQYFIPKPAVAPKPPETPQLPSEATRTEDREISVPEELSRQEKVLTLETGKYIVTFSNIGGGIKDIRMKEFTDPATKEPLRLVQIDNSKEYIFNMSGTVDSLSLDTSVYNVETDRETITYSLRAGDFVISKRYTLHNSNYIIGLELSITNRASSAKQCDYRIIGGAGVTEAKDQDKNFIEVTSKINGKINGFKRPKGGRIMHPGTVSWTALKNKYFSIILKPFVNTRGQFYGADKAGRLFMGVEPSVNPIGPGSSVEEKYLLYVGPSQEHILKKVGYEFDETINYGFFGAISKALISVMRFFYKLVRSWGVSIILLSIFLNIILFPLTVKSFKSMQKMQEIHPQMNKLKAQYKDNPQKLNKEIMGLYKQYKINPFSGCLPMLLQMPVFVALYQALIKSVELKNASFLWIKDLSLPDAVPIPFALPIFGNSINILPIIMIIAMVVQQKVSAKTMGAAVTDEQKQQQKIMLIMMPIMFGFIFYNMPSGLVLYWVVNTVLTLAEQAIILKQA